MAIDKQVLLGKLQALPQTVTLEALSEIVADIADGAGIPVELESGGESITIPAGSTVSEALQLIMDAIDPA